MKASSKVTAVVALVSGLAFGAAASAHWAGGMGPGNGPGQGAGPGYMMGGGHGVVSQLFTAEEQAAFREQMRNAKTPEERVALAQAHHTEVQRRAAERGITLPDCAGAGAGPFGGRGPMGRW